jgi:hypothetical protein
MGELMCSGRVRSSYSTSGTLNLIYQTADPILINLRSFFYIIEHRTNEAYITHMISLEDES